MKKLACILLCLVLVFSLCACAGEGKKEDKNNDTIVEETKENSDVFPSPDPSMWEKSENNLGARYTFTLEEFTQMLNQRCEKLGKSSEVQFFDYNNWTEMSDTLVDDNGIEYASFYYSTDALTITAAVENESGKVMNLGCGTSYEEFVNADADYQYTVMLTSAILAMTAGGYSDDALEFLYYIFFDSAKNNVEFFYNNSVYMLNMSKAEGEEGAALLFMMSPCEDEVLTSWELTDYKEYDGSYKDK